MLRPAAAQGWSSTALKRTSSHQLNEVSVKVVTVVVCPFVIYESLHIAIDTTGGRGTRSRYTESRLP